MRTRALLSTLALVTATAGGLSACGSSGGSSGGNSTDDYCTELKADKTYFDSLEKGDSAKLGTAFTKLHELADDAPSEVATEWKTLDGAITTVEKALKDAGVSADDLAAIQKGQVPQGVDVSKLQDLGPKLQALSSEKLTKAADAIEAHAKKECKVDLSSTG